MTDDAMRLGRIVQLTQGTPARYPLRSTRNEDMPVETVHLPKMNEHGEVLFDGGKTWQTTRPTEPGWYWAVAAAIPRAKPWVVFVDKSGYMVVPGFIRRSAVEPFTHWLGPLTVPEPPA